MFASILARKFNPNHDEKGRFASQGTGISGGSRNHLHEMFNRIGQPDGGFTYQPTTEEEPSEGYALSPYPEKSFAKPAKDLQFKDVVNYYLKNRDVFKQPDHFIGAWHDPASGMVFLDVSVVKHSEEEATKLALEKDQIAYFDLKNFKSVTVNPDAKSGVLKGIQDGQAAIAFGQTGFGSVFARKAVQAVDGPGADRSGTEGGAGNAEQRAAAQLIAQASKVLKFNPNHDTSNGQFTSGNSGPSESSVRSGSGEGKGISLRPQQPDAESADLIHYGREGGLTQLSASHYGTGIKGAEAARLAKSNDSNIKNRVYFYLNDGSGKLPRKEQGLGQHVYAVKLTNLYDFKKDPAKIIPRMRDIPDQTERSNFMESEIVKSGYDGYALKAYNMAVVLGKDVPVEYKGTDTAKLEGFVNVFKFNPNHDDKGRFTAGSAASLGGVLARMAAGEDHPNIMHLKVDGKTPFGGNENLGVSRIDMPQIPRADREQFIANLHANVTPEYVDPTTLKPTQNELDGRKVGSLYGKILAGEKHNDPILVSQEGFVVDGHHHWAASVAAKVTGARPNEKIHIYRIHMQHNKLMAAAHAYAKEKGYQSKDITKSELFSTVFKHNPNHGPDGKFTSGPSSAAFKEWFGDSKVVGEDGNPKVMYHATTADFDTFKDNPRGVHFVSPDPEWTSKFLKDENGAIIEGASVMPVYVKASNPFDFENKKHVNLIAAKAMLSSAQTKKIKAGDWTAIEDRTVLHYIKQSGFDGLYVKEDGVKNLAVFDPTQLKSTTGNNGQYDRKNPNIIKAEFSFAQVLKHNPYHDQLGRFATHGGAHFISTWGKHYAEAANAKAKPEEHSDPFAGAADRTTTHVDPAQRAKDQYKADQNALTTANAAVLGTHDSQSKSQQYTEAPTPKEQGLVNAFHNVVASHMEVYPHDMKDMAALEWAQSLDAPYASKYKLGLPLMDWEKEKVAKDLEDLKISKDAVGGGWTTPTDLGKYGEPKKVFDPNKVSDALDNHIYDMNQVASKVSNANYWKSSAEILDGATSQEEEAAKKKYQEMVRIAQEAAPGFEGQAEAQVSKLFSHAGMNISTKHKLGMYLTPTERDNIASTLKQINQAKAYNAGLEYQKAVEQMHMAQYTHSPEALAMAKVNASQAKEKAMGLGLDEYALTGYEEMAKDNAKYQFKEKQKEAEADFMKTLGGAHPRAPADGKLDPAVQQNKDFYIGKNLMTPEKADELIANHFATGKGLAKFHQELKAMIPEAKKVTEDFDNRSFSFLDPYSGEATQFFKDETQKYSRMSSGAKTAVKDYTSSGYKVNKAIGMAVTAKMLGQKPHALNSSEKLFMKQMDEATGHPINRDLMLRRNLPTKFLASQMGMTTEKLHSMSQEELEKTFVGKIYRDTTYGSTTINKNFNGTFSTAASQGEGSFFIRAPKGTKGLGVEHVTNNSGEHEVILQRGTTYVIRSVTKSEYSSHIDFNVDIIGQHPDKLD
jgi:hypothetical protein